MFVQLRFLHYYPFHCLSVQLSSTGGQQDYWQISCNQPPTAAITVEDNAHCYRHDAILELTAFHQFGNSEPAVDYNDTFCYTFVDPRTAMYHLTFSNFVYIKICKILMAKQHITIRFYRWEDKQWMCLSFQFPFLYLWRWYILNRLCVVITHLMTDALERRGLVDNLTYFKLYDSNI